MNFFHVRTSLFVVLTLVFLCCNICQHHIITRIIEKEIVFILSRRSRIRPIIIKSSSPKTVIPQQFIWHKHKDFLRQQLKTNADIKTPNCYVSLRPCSVSVSWLILDSVIIILFIYSLFHTSSPQTTTKQPSHVVLIPLYLTNSHNPSSRSRRGPSRRWKIYVGMSCDCCLAVF